MIIIPDIHGRAFWKKAVKKAKKGETIIFLGDYLDPYLCEFDPDTDKLISPSIALENFKEIIAFKKEHMEQVILLLGNHDTEYSHRTTEARCDYERFAAIEELICSNSECFTLGYHCTVNGQPYTFSHSCITEGWAKQAEKYLGPCKSPEEVIDKINSADEVAQSRALNQIGWERCGLDEFGSMVWADLDEAQNLGWNGCSTFQIFSHTLIQDGAPILTERYAMLDVRRGFRLDEDSTESVISKRIVEL